MLINRPVKGPKFELSSNLICIYVSVPIKFDKKTEMNLHDPMPYRSILYYNKQIFVVQIFGITKILSYLKRKKI